MARVSPAGVAAGELVPPVLIIVGGRARIGRTLLAVADQPACPAEPFLVVGTLLGAPLRITAASAVAAAVAADYWRSIGATAHWLLRDDIPHPRHIRTLFTQGHDHGETAVHATPLDPGQPVGGSAPPTETYCGRRIDWQIRTVGVCWPNQGKPCQQCLTRYRDWVERGPRST